MAGHARHLKVFNIWTSVTIRGVGLPNTTADGNRSFCCGFFKPEISLPRRLLGAVSWKVAEVVRDFISAVGF